MTAGSLFSFTVSKRPSAARSDSLAQKNVGDEKFSMVELKELGKKAFASQDYGQAHEIYTRAIAVARRDAGSPAGTEHGMHVLYANRSAVYMAICQYEDALADAEQAVALSPQPWAKAYFRRATAQAALHRNVLACQSWEKVVEVEEETAAASAEGAVPIKEAALAHGAVPIDAGSHKGTCAEDDKKGVAPEDVPAKGDGKQGSGAQEDNKVEKRPAAYVLVEGGGGCQQEATDRQEDQSVVELCGHGSERNGTSDTCHISSHDNCGSSITKPDGAVQGGGVARLRVSAIGPRARSPELKQGACRLADTLLLLFRGLACPRPLKPGEEPQLNELRADLDEGGYERLVACAGSQQHEVASAAGIQLAVLASAFEFRMKYLQPNQGLDALLHLVREPLANAYEGPHAGLESICRARLGTGYNACTPALATVVGIANLTLGAPPVFCRELGSRPGVLEATAAAIARAQGDMKIRDVAAKCFESMTAMCDPTLAQRAHDSGSVPALLDLLAMDVIGQSSANKPRTAEATGAVGSINATGSAAGSAAATTTTTAAAAAGGAGAGHVVSTSLNETQEMTCRGSALAALASLCRHPPVDAIVLEDELVRGQLLGFILKCLGSYNCDAVLTPCFALLSLMAKKCAGDGPGAFEKQLLAVDPDLMESLRKLTVIKRGGGSAEAARSGSGGVGAGVRAESRSLLRKLEAAGSKA
eukprot:jgi/Mesvir1/26867/Mv20610-RA.1